VLAGYIYISGYAYGYSPDMDASISGCFQVLDIWQYTPPPDVCYVHIRCATVSGQLGF